MKKNKHTCHCEGRRPEAISLLDCFARAETSALARNNRGFLLLEVILSVLVVGVGITVVVQAYLASMRGASMAQAYFKAVSALEERLFETDCVGGFAEGVKEAAQQGHMEPGADCDWFLHVAPYDGTKDAKLNLVSMSVTCRQGGRSTSVSAATLRKNKTL